MTEIALEEYDFIIVGGGTSGLVVARRLTEDPNVTVLVLEAGTDMREDPRVKTPALFETLKGTGADWAFETEPQQGLDGRKLNLSQGRVLGGSSAINANVFVPPSKTVIDSWEKLGSPGWNWDTLKPYYTKSFTLPQPDSDTRERLGINWEIPATSGPLKPSYTQDPKNPLSKAWNETFQSLGFGMKGNPFSGDLTGAFTPLSSINQGERTYSAVGFYTAIAERKNLRVLTKCLVENIIFVSEFPKINASGVNFHQDGKPTFALARKEVILAAGSLQSPKILELSGIGDSNLLSAQGIEVLVNNPGVGENLQTHVVCGLGFEAKDGLPTLDGLVRQEPKVIEAAMGEYMANKTGPLSSNGVAAFAFLPVMEFLSDEGSAKLQEILDANTPSQTKATNPAAEACYDVVRSILIDKADASAAYLAVATQIDIIDSPLGPTSGNYVSMGAMLSMPLSRGSVHINSPSPTAKPTIDPRILTHPIDMEILSRHIQYIETIAASEPLSSTVLKKGGRRREPNTPLKNLDDAKKYIRARGYDMWHPTSTCSMLPRELGGVVDDQLIVYGTRNLRVVDASVMPIIPRANIQSSVYAVAERAADLIKAEHGLSSALDG